MSNALSDAVLDLVDASMAKNTRLTYDGAMKRFTDWCKKDDLNPLPASAETIAEYMAQLSVSGIKGSTIKTYLAGIIYHHRDAGHPDPGEHMLVQKVLRGAMRKNGMRPIQKVPTETDSLRLVLQNVPHDLRGIRDRAILCIGFAGAMRRSEVTALEVSDLTFVSEGVRVLIRRSKTDQVAMGADIAIPWGRNLFVVEALQDWIDAAGITEGPLFRPIYHCSILDRRMNPVIVAKVIKKYVTLAGFDAGEFSGHSLRSGFITEAANAGVDILTLMAHSRHRTTRQLRDYVRKADLFKRHPGASFL